MYQPPTNEEIQGLKETTDLYKSNLFKFQIDELLSEVSIDFSKTTSLENILHKLKEIFENINDQPDLSITDVKSMLLKKHGIIIPFPDPQPSDDVKYKFGFKKPTAFYLVGSYPLKSVVRSRNGFNVDVVVIMPKDIFQEKDYMNYRYFYKRAYYLAILSATLQDKGLALNVNVEFGALLGDRRCPIILLKPLENNSDALDFTIRILPCIPMDLFSTQRLSPSRNNIRPQHFQDLGQISQQQSVDSLPPTPQYNSAILSDMYCVSHLNLLYKNSKDCLAFNDACKLAKVWLHQRGIGGDEDGWSGFNGFVWKMLMCYLLHGGGVNGGKKLANGYSSYQLIKGTMDFLANHDFIRNPVFMNKLEESEEFSEKSFTENFDVVFVDNSGKLNLFCGMTKTALEQIQHEARIAMEYFNENKADRFEALFLQNVNDIKLRYDNVAKITQIPTSYCNYTKSEKLDYHDPFIHFARTVPIQLKQGLTNRVNLITINYPQLPTWSTSSEPPSYSFSNLKLYIGFIFNPEQSNRLIDYGPSPEDETAASEFRKLWGKKAEVRRFKDGSILECVVWNVKGIEERCLIVSRIVQYLINLHYGIKGKGIQYFTGQLNEIVIPSTNIPKSIYNKNGIANGFRDVMQAYDKLVKQFMALENIPLRFSGIRAASPALRYTSIFIPQPLTLTTTNISHYIDPIEIIIQFEHSARWPDDLVAIQKMKIAFYIRLASELELQFPGTCVTVAADNSDTIISEAYMDILSDSRFTFRCRIHNEREITLLDRGIKDKKSNQLKKDMYTKALEREKRMFVEIPMHTLQIQTLCNKWPSLSLTIRLTKRWFSTHLLSDHVDEEWIECLSSQVYLEPCPWNRPGSGFVGFLRVLKLITSWDWNNEAMIVDLSEENKSSLKNNTYENNEDIKLRFKNLRASGGSCKYGLMFIGTTSGSAWGIDKPCKVVANRIKDLARSALLYADELIEKRENSEFKRLFVTPLSDYDVIIHLDPSQCTRYYQNIFVDTQYLAHNKKNMSSLKIYNIEDDDVVMRDVKMQDHEENLKKEKMAAMIGFDPVEYYLDELRKLYSDVALFFHDKHGGTIIGVVWIPTNFTPRPWKASTEINSILVSKIENLKDQKGSEHDTNSSNLQDQNIVLNTKAVVLEIERLGEGFVTGIEVRK